jgi:hypothetical protein
MTTDDTRRRRPLPGTVDFTFMYRAVWRPGYARTPRWDATTIRTNAERPTR